MSTEKFSQLNSLRSLMRSMSIISLGTLTSRILGFVRDIILAKFFGTGFRADAFFVAFRIPNLFRDMVGEGAANSAVVPVLSEYLHRDKQEQFWRFVSVILVLAMLVLSAITLFGIIFTPLIIRILAPGFLANPEKLLLTIRLTKILFPYLIFIGLTAYSMAILYTFRKFSVPAFSPCLLNVAIIVSTVLSVKFLTEPVYGLAAGVLIGGVLQFAVQIPPLFKMGYHFQRPATLRHPGVFKVGSLLLPRMVGAGVYQLTIFVDTFCASLSSIVGAGGISAVYYANRIIQLPMGVFGVALASAILPTLASFSAQKDIPRLRATLVFAVQNILFVMAPISIITMVLSGPIIRILFERGAFDGYSTAVTSSALLFYAIGLFAFGGIKILVAAFYSMQDTKTPVKVAAACLVINAVLNFILMWPMKVAGIALASSIGALINFSLLLWLMNRRVGGLLDGLRIFVVRIMMSACLAGLLTKWMWYIFCGWWNDIVCLFLVPALGTAVYMAACYYFDVHQARRAVAWIREQGAKVVDQSKG